MILEILTIIIVTFINLIFAPFNGTVELAQRLAGQDYGSMPFGIDEIFVTGVAYLKTFMLMVPFIYTIFNAFIILIAWKAILLLLKIALGSRVPTFND